MNTSVYDNLKNKIHRSLREAEDAEIEASRAKAEAAKVKAKMAVIERLTSMLTSCKVKNLWFYDRVKFEWYTPDEVDKIIKALDYGRYDPYGKSKTILGGNFILKDPSKEILKAEMRIETAKRKLKKLKVKYADYFEDGRNGEH